MKASIVAVLPALVVMLASPCADAVPAFNASLGVAAFACTDAQAFPLYTRTFTAVSGQRYWVRTANLNNYTGFTNTVDTVVRVLNTSNNTVVASDDDVAPGQLNSDLEYTASGTFTARVVVHGYAHDRFGRADVLVNNITASERALGRDPRVSGKQTPAYDLQVGDPGHPDARFIRVVGLDGAWDRVQVVLSARHYNAGRAFGRNFWLYVVEHALEPTRAKVHRIHDPISRVARFVFDHRWRVQSEHNTGGIDSHLGWSHQAPDGERGVIEAVEAVGMFIWLRVRLADGTLERRFYKPGLDRLLAPQRPALAADGPRA